MKFPSTRATALRLGVSRYKTGHACSRGHVALRRTSNTNCCSCITENRRNKRKSEPFLKSQARYRLKLKVDVLRAYSFNRKKPGCACCGEDELWFLTIDHIDGKGADHRRSLSAGVKCGNNKVYRFLRQNGYPKGFQVLCFNCNAAKHLLGCCPHKKGKK